MRIAFVNPQGNFDPNDSHWTAHPDFGGQLVYVKQVALAMAELGHQVDILTRRIRDPEWPEFGDNLDAYPESSAVRIVRLPCGGDAFLRKEDLWPHISEWVDNIVAFYGGSPPDAATGHYGDGGLAAAQWHVRGGPAFTFTGHSLGAQKRDRLLAQGANEDQLDQQYVFPTRIAAERVAMSQAGCVITSTEQERREQYTHPSYADASADTRFAVVPPGVNLAIFGADIKDDGRVARDIEAVLQHDLEHPDRPTVVSSSRLDPKKNHLDLVRAFAHSRELSERANLILVLRGLANLSDRTGLSPDESDLLDAIEAIVRDHGIERKVCVLSLAGQSDLAAAYRHLRARQSVFALTALYEPFGLAPLEAMAAGLPAVVTQNGGPSESLHENGERYGVLVDPESPPDIARGLLEALADWQGWHDAGRARVLARYTWDKTAAGYLAAIENLAGS